MLAYTGRIFASYIWCMRTTQQIENQIKVLEKKWNELNNMAHKDSRLWSLSGKIAKLRKELKDTFNQQWLGQ